MEEIWKDIEGYDGRYQVSNLGNVRSVDHVVKVVRYVKYKGKAIKPFTDKDGYKCVRLGSSCHKKVHRLVANAFINNPNGYNQVNHIDLDKSNNDYKNLEWCTCTHNIKHSYSKNKDRGRGGAKFGKNPNSRAICQYEGSNLIREYDSISRVREFGFTPWSVSKSIRYNRPYAGFIWKYKD